MSEHWEFLEWSIYRYLVLDFIKSYMDASYLDLPFCCRGRMTVFQPGKKRKGFALDSANYGRWFAIDVNVGEILDIHCS